jgi:hypothetical protein
MRGFSGTFPSWKFASIDASVHNHFPTERHIQTRDAALAEWRGLLAA